MLISPPFLPICVANQSDAAWLNTAMQPHAPGHIPKKGHDVIAGSYPISLEMGWHGGVHLVAPIIEGNTALPVRAIADGKIVYVPQPTSPVSNDSNHPLNYGAAEGQRCWTSDGVVVIKHETDIGYDATTQQSASVVFYSVYVHLHGVRATVRTDQSIYRKDEIGAAGYIYGQSNRIHFEIVCDESNLRKLTNRTSGTLSLVQSGRSDAIFGSRYFYLPVGTKFYAAKQALNIATPPEKTTAAHTSTTELIVELKYQHGDAVFTTLQTSGTLVGINQTAAQAEYNLYTTANHISEAYPANSRPTPSAVYELLRFGRVISPDETLTPDDVPNWQHVSYPGGVGWVNLNAANVKIFSDADFPDFKGWSFIDDGGDGDSRCDSDTIKGWFETNGTAGVSAKESTAGHQNQSVLNKLKHAICRFPSDWAASTLDSRWSWLKSETTENPQPLTDDDYAKFKAHAEKLCFWDNVPDMGYLLWHFHPAAFIEHFRMCGWLSLREMTQLVPKKSRAMGAKEIRWGASEKRFTLAATAPDHMPASLHPAFNVAFRKYGFESHQRQAHFFGQVFEETSALTNNIEKGGDYYFKTMYESITAQEADNDYDTSQNEGQRNLRGMYHKANGQKVEYTRQEYVNIRPGQIQQKAQGLGNTQQGDGPRFRGRGLIQLTGRNNYAKYGTFRQRDYTTDPNPTLLADNAAVTTDLSMFYWVSKPLAGHININRRADEGTNTQTVTQVTQAVNGGETGLPHRQEYFGYVWSILNDAPGLPDTNNLKRQKE